MERQQAGLHMIDRRKNDDVKEALKEALRDWLDEKFMLFGKWSAVGLATLMFGALVYIILRTQGWTPPH